MRAAQPPYMTAAMLITIRTSCFRKLIATNGSAKAELMQ